MSVFLKGFHLNLTLIFHVFIHLYEEPKMHRLFRSFNIDFVQS